jgi:hypothetical protein
MAARNCEVGEMSEVLDLGMADLDLRMLYKLPLFQKRRS